MARKQLIKSPDETSIALPTNENKKFVAAALFKVDSLGNIAKQEKGKARFLLNPDAMEDNKAGNWVENNVPGQSDPILQWVSGGSRTLSFTALVTKDFANFKISEQDLLGDLKDTALTAVGSIASAFAGINIPPLGDALNKLVGDAKDNGEELGVSEYLDYYRSLMYPDIDEEGVLQASPPLVVLAMGKTLTTQKERNVTGTVAAKNTDLWITKNVSVRVTKWLPNLTPMEAEVSFQFVQYIMESRGSVYHKQKEVEPKPDVGDFNVGDIGSYA